MKQERVIAILDFYRDIDKTVTMNERVIRNLEDQLLRRHDEELLDEIDERERQRQDDERRRNYD